MTLYSPTSKGATDGFSITRQLAPSQPLLFGQYLGVWTWEESGKLGPWWSECLVSLKIGSTYALGFEGFPNEKKDVRQMSHNQNPGRRRLVRDNPNQK